MDKESEDLWQELKKLEYESCGITSRCCRAVQNGAVKICEVEDDLLMSAYKPKLKYCPECGKELK